MFILMVVLPVFRRRYIPSALQARVWMWFLHGK